VPGNLLTQEEFDALEGTESPNISDKQVLTQEEFDLLGRTEESILNNDGNKTFSLEKSIFNVLSRGVIGFGENLMDDEKAKTFSENIKESYQRGDDSQNVSMLEYHETLGELDFDTDIKPVKDALEKRLSEREIKGENLFSNSIYKVSGMLPPIISGTLEGVILGAEATLAVSAVPGGLAFAPVAFTVGQTTGSVNYWYKLGTGELSGILRTEGIERDIRVPVAHVFGLMWAGIEFSQVDKLLPGTKAATKTFVMSSVRKATGRMVKQFGINWAQEVGEEGVQKFIFELASELANDLSNKSVRGAGSAAISGPTGISGAKPEFFLKAIMASVKEMQEAALPMLFMMGPASVTGTVKTLEGVSKAKALEAQVNKLLDIREAAIEEFEKEVAVLDPELPETRIGDIDPDLEDEAFEEPSAKEKEEKKDKPTADDFALEIVKLSFDESLAEGGIDEQFLAEEEIFKIAAEQGITKEDILDAQKRLRKQFGKQKKKKIEDSDVEADASFDFAEKIAEEIQAEPGQLSDLEKKLEKLEGNKLRADFAREALKEMKPITEFFNRSVNVKKDSSFSKDEIRRIPQRFRTNKEEAMSLDELREAANEANIGRNFETKDDLIEFLEALDRQEKKLTQTIEENRPKIVSKEERTELAQRIVDIKSGIRAGKRLSKEEARAVQEDFIGILKASALTDKDKEKFTLAIKNTQTHEQFAKLLPEIENRIARLEAAQTGRITRSAIGKILSRSKKKKQSRALRKGRYDYETNKIFTKLREHNKLSQSGAQKALEAMGDATTEMEAIEQRFLSLKANGAEASAAIHRQVLRDMRRLVKVGEESKNAQDFERKVERKERVDELNAGIDRVKAKKGTVKTTIINAYLRGFSNIYSMINGIAGKKMAEKYDPLLQQSKKSTAILLKTEEVSNKLAEIFKIKSSRATAELVRMENEKFKLVDFEGIEREYSKLDLLDIYNSIKNEAIRERYYRTFTEDQITEVLGNVTEEEAAFADYMQEVAQSYYDVLNARNIELRNIDLGIVENYWPATSKKPLDIYDDFKAQSETPSALKERAKGRVIPVPKNAWLKLHRHIVQAEHVAHLSRNHETLMRLFTDSRVEDNIRTKFGDGVYEVLMNQINEISLNNQTVRLDDITKIFGKAINNWVVAKVALNPSVFVKQLISTGNYMEIMNVAEWNKFFFEGVKTPKQTFDFMWKNVPFIRARFRRGYSEAIQRAIEEAGKIGGNKEGWVNALTSFVRAGDIGAIIYGGYPVIQSELAKHGDMKKAIDVLETATPKSQQSGLSSSLSQFQNSKNPFIRLFLAFKNTSTQYLRKQADAIISHLNGDISTKQLAKTLLIYSVIQPAMYGAAGVIVRNVIFDSGDEDKEFFDELFAGIMDALIMNPFNAIPILDDIVYAAIRAKLRDKPVWEVISIPMISDLGKATRKLLKKDVAFEDVMSFMGTFAEPITGAPVSTFKRLFKRFLGKEKKKSFL